MSLFHLKGKSADQVQNLVTGLRTTIAQQGGALADESHTQAVISTESLNAAQQSEVQHHFREVADTLKHVLADSGYAMESLSTASLESGAIAAMAVGNPRAYAQAAYNARPRSGDGISIVEPNSIGTDYRLTPAMEAFDEKELREHMPFNIAYNVMAARQDDFSEAFYPTTVCPPDQGGLDITVARQLVYNEVRHAVSGKPASWERKNLIDAVVDYTILSEEQTRLVPVALEDNSNAANFVAPAIVGATFTQVAGVQIRTAPLAAGRQIDLLGVSAHPGLLGNNIIDNTDSIDGRIALEAIYLQTDAAGAEPGVKFSTGSLPRSLFMANIEGSYREMNLQFTTRDLVIDKNSKAVDGTDVDAFALIAANSLTVRLGLDVNGSANVQLGDVKVYGSPVSVVSILDENGNAVDMGAGLGAQVVTALAALKLAGYDLKTNRTNSNRRTRGLQLDTDFVTERHTIPLGSPISVPQPLTDTRDSAHLRALITATHVRNSNMAVTQMFNYANTLRSYVRGPKIEGNVPQVAGSGRWLIQPFFEEHDLDMLKAINSVKSHEKAIDVQGVLVNAIRDIAYRMHRDTRIKAALDAVNGAGGEQPVLVIGTDPVLIRHLMVQGDSRTFGTVFEDHEIVSTLDKRMKDKIVLTFKRKASTGADPLNFGTHAWIPELASTVNVTRNGATVKESMVQPRNLHVNNLPAMAIINVENLSYVLAERIEVPTDSTELPHTWMDGLTYP